MEKEDKSISNLIKVLGVAVEDQINNAIKNTNRLEDLDSLLKFKIKSLSSNDTIKHFNFPLKFIYEDHNCSESIVSSILENALMVQESNCELKTLIRYTTNRISPFCQQLRGSPLTIDLKSGSKSDRVEVEEAVENAAHLLSIINVIFRICRIKYYKDTLEEFIAASDLEGFLIARLKSGNEEKFFIQSEILPFFITQSRNNQFIRNVFDFIFENRELTLLCGILKPWILEADQVNLNYLFKSNKFWILLESCISGRNMFEQKQACFILKISVNYIIHNVDYKSHYYKYLHGFEYEYEYIEEIEAALGSFFLLIDISNEKQLHLVQPCLGLLEKVNNLNLIWKLCIYKILLNHMQDSIVQNVAVKIISTNLDDKLFCDKIIGYLLRAINKNDCSDLSLNVYKHLNSFCLKCNEKQLSLLIKEATEINWNPTSMWLFCRNVIDPVNVSKLNFELFLNFFSMVEKLPHIYIRKGCLSYITNVYFNYHSNIKLNDIIIFLKNTNNFKTTYFNSMIQKSDQDKLLHYENELLNIVKDNFETKLKDIDYFRIICELTKMIKSIKIVDIIKINENNFSKELQSVIYLYMFELFDFKTIFNFAAENLITLNGNNIDVFTELLSKVIAHGIGNLEILFFKSLDIINDNTYSYDSYEKRLAFFIIKHDLDKFDQVINILQPAILLMKDKIDAKICEYFLEIYFHRYPEKKDRNLNEVLKLLNNILTINPGIMLPVVRRLKTLFIVHEKELELDSLFEFTKTCIQESELNKKVFLECVDIIIQNLYLPKIFNNYKYRKQLCEIILEIYCSSKSNDELLIVIKHINELAVQKFQDIATFIPLVVDLILGGIIVNKNERCEYSICQDIYNQKIDQLEISCPNYQRAEIRRYALETVLEASKNDEYFVVQLIDCLLSRYKKNYGKRYFPESEVYFIQLRIIQSLLLIHEYIPETYCRQEIIDFILNSFCDEIHQPCIKQLMQWLLILILKNTKSISDKINIANRSQPSTITAFIPVLYHITLKSKTESIWNETVQTLLPWTMGAHFKLRVYSQEGILRLYKMAQKRQYETFLELNQGLHHAVKDVVDSSGESFKTTIKQDIGFFEYFDPKRDFSKRTIFIDIPRYNYVSPNEWECFVPYKNIDAENRIFSDHVDDILRQVKETTYSSDNQASLEVVQRKITPWKNAFDVDNNYYSKQKVCDIILVTSLIEKTSNVGGLSRTCEIFGVSTFVLNSMTIVKDKEFKSLSMSSENWVNFVEVKKHDLINFTKRGKSQGYVAVGAEQTNDSTSLEEYKFPKKCIIILGNEKEGIPPDIISVLDKCIEIPQFGVTRSLNVHVAGSLLIWEYVKQHLT